MSNEPKVTRFGADPTVDQELATKAYVDAGGGGGDKRVLLGVGGTINAYTNNVTRFPPITAANYTNLTGIGTEANWQITIDWELTIKRLLVRWETNSKNGDTIMAFRDDGVNVAPVTVAASTTGEFDSGDVTGLIASGSAVNFIVDTTASSSGTLDDLTFNVWGFET